MFDKCKFCMTLWKNYFKWTPPTKAAAYENFLEAHEAAKIHFSRSPLIDKLE